jgi:hypothetical protein
MQIFGTLASGQIVSVEIPKANLKSASYVTGAFTAQLRQLGLLRLDGEEYIVLFFGGILLEDRHWYYLARNRCVNIIINQLPEHASRKCERSERSSVPVHPRPERPVVPRASEAKTPRSEPIDERRRYLLSQVRNPYAVTSDDLRRLAQRRDITVKDLEVMFREYMKMELMTDHIDVKREKRSAVSVADIMGTHVRSFVHTQPIEVSVGDTGWKKLLIACDHRVTGRPIEKAGAVDLTVYHRVVDQLVEFAESQHNSLPSVLRLNTFACYEEDFDALAKIEMPNVTEVVIARHEVPIRRLDFIPRFPQLNTLTLSSHMTFILSPDLLNDLCGAVNVRTLNINSISRVGLISEILANPDVLPNLHTLRIHSSDLTAEGMLALVRGLETGKRSRIRELDIGGNPIGDEGAASLARLLKSGVCPNLHTLALERCRGLGKEGALKLVEALSDPRVVPNLHVLNLSNNRIGEGVREFYRMFERGARINLRELNIIRTGSPVDEGSSVTFIRTISDPHLAPNLRKVFLFSTLVNEEELTRAFKERDRFPVLKTLEVHSPAPVTNSLRRLRPHVDVFSHLSIH